MGHYHPSFYHLRRHIRANRKLKNRLSLLEIEFKIDTNLTIEYESENRIEWTDLDL